MKVVIVGLGAIGKERLRACEKLPVEVVGIVEPNATLSQLADFPCYENLAELLNSVTPDWVFVCTPHDLTAKYVVQAITFGCNVLAEKPLGRTVQECTQISDYINTETVNVGFNYRYYRGVNRLLNDIKHAKFGRLISVNMILGLGDAPGTEKTWRLDVERAGRGAILDPGIHLIDLAMIISDKTLKKADSISTSKFWNTGFEEETHILAFDDNEVIYNIQVSKVRWRNTFRIEVNGTDGYGIIEGRNRNYGQQTYRTGRRWGWKSGIDQRYTEEIEVISDGEDSFIEETKAVLFGSDAATWEDNLRCLEFIES